MTGQLTVISFSACRSTLYRPGSRSSSSAARSKRDIIASKGFTSLRKRSLSGRTILSVGKRRSVAMGESGGRPRVVGRIGIGGTCTEDGPDRCREVIHAVFDDYALRNIP